jgi:prepilin-type N-terminal cleavage/methylation domain-containing protein
MRRAAGFTLIEILIVMSIIAILSSLTTAGFLAARRQARRARARSDIASISVALAAFHARQGEVPHASGAARDDPETLFRALCTGNPALGGTVEDLLETWKAEDIGLFFGFVADSAHVWEHLDEERLAEIGRRYVPCALLDPWGRPYHYVAWEPLGDAERAAARAIVEPPGGAAYSIWSDGPDRVDDRGRAGGDDVTSWSE